jgi:hypothetical protein
MAFSGVRHTKKILKEVNLAIADLQKAKEHLEYCNDTKGLYCDGRPDEVDASKEETEGEALSCMSEAEARLSTILTENGMM